jgi:uncharacterized SAM-binding protein YcdF (DUF218 family)
MDAPGDTQAATEVSRAEPEHVAPVRRRRRVRKFALGFVMLLALYFAFTFVQVWNASRTDSPRPSEAIVVLGAAQYDGRPSPALAARLDRAFELWEDGVAPRIVTTGSNMAGDRFTEAEAGAAYLIDRGVPADAIIAVEVGTNTWEELEATEERLSELGLSRVVLVSHPYHAHRVAQVADEVGLDASVVSTPGGAPLGRLLTEAAGASLGRLVGYRFLAELG